MILLLIQFLLFTSSGPLGSSSDVSVVHDFHISKCNINYHEESRSVQIVLHVFIDDLEMVLDKNGYKNLHLCTDKEIPEAEQYMNDYLLNELNIFIDGEPSAPEFLGKEVSEDLIAVWCYYEIYDVAFPSSIALSNTIMMNEFDDQKNIINVEVNSERKAYWLFDTKYTSDQIQL